MMDIYKPNKDFYKHLSELNCMILDRIITEYSDRDWFEEAWEEYRHYVLKDPKNEDMKRPGEYVFNFYINGGKW